MTKEVTYTGTARVFSTAAHGGVIAEQNESVEVDDDAAEFLLRNHDFEEADGDATESDSTDDENVDESSEDATESVDLDDSEAGAWMTDLEGVGPQKADDLEDAGYPSREDIEAASAEELAAVDGISESLAESIKEQLG